jgi:hypothetical protein
MWETRTTRAMWQRLATSSQFAWKGTRNGNGEYRRRRTYGATASVIAPAAFVRFGVSMPLTGNHDPRFSH